MKKLLIALILASSFSLTTVDAAPQASQTATPIVELNSSNADGLLSTKKYLVVKVYADWCGPCKTLSPIFEAVANDQGNNYTFATLNSDKERQLATKFGVQGLPTIIFFKDGKEVGRNTGSLSQSALKDRLTTTFAK